MANVDRVHRVLFVLDIPPVTAQQGAQMLAQVAAAYYVARASAITNGSSRAILSIAALVTLDAGESLSQGALAAQALRGVLDRLIRQNREHIEADAFFEADTVEVQPIVRVCAAASAAQEVADILFDSAINLLLVDWRWGWQAATTQPTAIDELLHRPLCDVAVLGPNVDVERAQHILLAVRGGPYAMLAADIATTLAAQTDGTVTQLHVLAPNSDPDYQQLEDEFYGDFVRYSTRSQRVQQELRVSDDPLGTILDEAQQHDLIVLGASAATAPDGDAATPADSAVSIPAAFGPVAGAIIARLEAGATQGLIIVRARAPQDFYFAQAQHRQKMQQEMLSDPAYISQVVDKWFAENTFDANEFTDIERLIAMKRSQGLKISLGLPALNEAATVGEVISTIKSELYDRHRLLDEIVLIDSQSSDDTVKIARDLGLPVYVHQETLPEQGARRGKGEALWKSLYVLQGDIIAWVDTDVKNMDARFVYGLIGPLLAEPRLKYIKGYYRRPIQIGETVYQTGGGRVTELTVRPLFNLFFPELSGLIQPLAGEYAGRRECLEQLPFFTGYGVETGHLIDVLQRFGLAALAQVNLQERVHRNQELTALSQMAFALTQVIVSRINQRDKNSLAADVNKNMKLIRHGDNGLSLDVRRIDETERPPMLDIPEYRQKHRRRLSRLNP